MSLGEKVRTAENQTEQVLKESEVCFLLGNVQKLFLKNGFT